jgi:hypothetical protein
MYIQFRLQIESFITLHTYTNILDYVCISTPSDDPIYLMIYYKHHRKMDILHYECDGVS